MGILALALLLDLFIGDPDWLWRRIPHPVVWFGKVIDWFDTFRDKSQFAQFRNVLKFSNNNTFLIVWGVLLLLAFLGIAYLIAAIAEALGFIGILFEIVLVAVLIAQKSLYDHVNRVALALKEEGIPSGRRAVAMIVGRNVSELDETGICKAAIESLAENFSDGVVAPVFWYAVAGLPGIVFYKAVNTADSMIGHRTERHEYFGKPAAKLDDLMNWPAARLSSILVVIAVALGRGKRAAGQVWHKTRRDASLHRSPNAGWPETSFAAALGLSLGGDRQYGDEYVSAPALNQEGREHIKTSDVDKALALFLRSCFAMVALVALIGLITL